MGAWGAGRSLLGVWLREIMGRGVVPKGCGLDGSLGKGGDQSGWVLGKGMELTLPNLWAISALPVTRVLGV